MLRELLQDWVNLAPISYTNLRVRLVVRVVRMSPSLRGRCPATSHGPHPRVSIRGWWRWWVLLLLLGWHPVTRYQLSCRCWWEVDHSPVLHLDQLLVEGLSFVDQLLSL